MQTAGDNRSLSLLLMERVEPGSALEFGNDAHLHGHLGAAVSQARVETSWLRFEGKEPAHPDVRDAGAPEEEWQPPHEPAVHRRRIGRRGDDATRESTIRMSEDRHICVEVEHPEASSGSKDSSQFGDGRLPVWNMGQHRRTHHDVE